MNFKTENSLMRTQFENVLKNIPSEHQEELKNVFELMVASRIHQLDFVNSKVYKLEDSLKYIFEEVDLIEKAINRDQPKLNVALYKIDCINENISKRLCK